jgi:hypothetical protein
MIGGEDPEEFGKLHRSLVEEFGPRAGAEYELVFRLAVLFWRLRRIPVLEATFLRSGQSEGAEGYRDPRVDKLIELETLRRKSLREIAKRFSAKLSAEEPIEDEYEGAARAIYDQLSAQQPDRPMTSGGEIQERLSQISRYETSLMNSISRTFNMLIGLQNMRTDHAERRRITDK